MRASLVKSLLVGFLLLPYGADAQTTKVYGQTYGEWAAKWLAWAEAGPDGANSIQDTTGEFCDDNQPAGPVWFLAGSFGKVGVHRNCTIPKQKALFYPLVEGGWVDCPNSTDSQVPDAAVRALLAGVFDGSCRLTSTVDETSISALEIISVRAQSPKFTHVLPNNPAQEVANSCAPPLQGGRTGRRIVEGYWVMLPPLTPGPHTVTLHGGACDFSNPPNGTVYFENEVTYHLTVTNK